LAGAETDLRKRRTPPLHLFVQSSTAAGRIDGSETALAIRASVRGALAGVMHLEPTAAPIVSRWVIVYAAGEFLVGHVS
jgi:hypothetical protein